MRNLVIVKKSQGKGRGVFAKKPLTPGMLVVRGRPLKVVDNRTDYSFQVDKDKHVQLSVPARIINHSCSPNLGVKNNKLGGYDFIALRKIEAGEELTWDYCMTEFVSIAIEQQCLCGDASCRKNIRGFISLPEEVREKYGEFIGNYLKRY
jgi:uncharacterized protein